MINFGETYNGYGEFYLFDNDKLPAILTLYPKLIYWSNNSGYNNHKFILRDKKYSKYRISTICDFLGYRIRKEYHDKIVLERNDDLLNIIVIKFNNSYKDKDIKIYNNIKYIIINEKNKQKYYY